MKKKTKLGLLMSMGVIISMAIWHLMVPDVRHLPLTMREMMLLNSGFGDTTALFELRRGEYELHLYHYHFGERVADELLNHEGVFNRTGLIAFYSNMSEDETISFGMRTEGIYHPSFLTIDLESFGGKGSEPLDDRIFRIRDEQALMSYQFTSNGGFRVISNADFNGFGERLDAFAEIDHVVFITIRRVN